MMRIGVRRRHSGLSTLLEDDVEFQGDDVEQNVVGNGAVATVYALNGDCMCILRLPVTGAQANDMIHQTQGIQRSSIILIHEGQHIRDSMVIQTSSETQLLIRNPKASAWLTSAWHSIGDDTLNLADQPAEAYDDYECVVTALDLEQAGHLAGGQFEFASEHLRDNEKIVSAAVKQSGLALEKASRRQKDNEEFVLRALKSHNNGVTSGSPLEWASGRLRDDEEVVLAAVNKNCAALMYASERLQDNEELVFAALKSHRVVCRHVSERLLEWASERLRDNEEIVLAAVSKTGGALRYASERLRDNEKIVLAAAKEDFDSLACASEWQRHCCSAAVFSRPEIGRSVT
eukprot:gnl/MRDRNA2_/MRDRNA2_84235_c0_seq3.p1 gnl/MRDRNA2_/MRDRNA2_84235_c0~~gnl/MRDRNA2_/MRDRNA2_84235_c0_seq3.p1  ORF type:complete len:346 (-),score=63.29 gnl/MRDRNA2_/MRDRNA2_84235_c0_seq3:169-1206(-)